MYKRTNTAISGWQVICAIQPVERTTTKNGGIGLGRIANQLVKQYGCNNCPVTVGC